MPDLNNFDLEKYQGIAVEYGISIVLALLIFYVGRMVVNRVVSVISKLMDRRGTDATLTSFVCSILRWVGVLFVVIASLSQLGIDTTSLVALLGAAGLAIGLSLQGSLGNFAAGVMLIVFKPFQKGHFVEVAGTMGSVDSISIFTTVLTTPDNKEVIVPNGAIIAGNIARPRKFCRTSSPLTTVSCQSPRRGSALANWPTPASISSCARGSMRATTGTCCGIPPKR